MIKTKRRKKGFTLIELLVTISLLGVITTVVLMVIDPATRMAQARDVQRKTELREIANALESYYVVHGQFPSHSQEDPRSCGRQDDEDELRCGSALGGRWHTNDFTATLDVLLKENFLRTLPLDPVNNAFASVWQENGFSYFYLSLDANGGKAGEYFILGAFLEDENDPATLDNLGGDPNLRPKWPDCTTDIGFSGHVYLLRSYKCANDPVGSL